MLCIAFVNVRSRLVVSELNQVTVFEIFDLSCLAPVSPQYKFSVVRGENYKYHFSRIFVPIVLWPHLQPICRNIIFYSENLPILSLQLVQPWSMNNLPSPK